MNTLIDRQKLKHALHVMENFVEKDFQDIDWDDNTARTIRASEQVITIASRIENMPSTFGQSDKGDEAIAFLRYSKQNSEQKWYLTEKDTDAEQFQAFGAMKDDEDAELIVGHIRLPNILKKGFYIDLDFEPTTLSEIMGNNLRMAS